MAEISINVASGTPFDTTDDAVLTITVINTELIPSAAGTDAYYYIDLSDGTSEQSYTFAVAQTGSIPAAHEEVFVVENTVLGEITESSGIIYYTAA